MSARAPFPHVDDRAPCCSGDPDRFFATTEAGIAAAKDECRTACPFRGPCYAYALTHLVEGVWAATDDDERRAHRERHHIDAAPLSFGAGMRRARAEAS